MLAFAYLADFQGDSSLTTWLSRIPVNAALGRLRKRRRVAGGAMALPVEAAEIIPFPFNPDGSDPERTLAQRQILKLVEEAADKLPEAFRTVFCAKVIQAMSVDETAQLLDQQPQTVKTPLHRARSLLRKELDARIGPIPLGRIPPRGPSLQTIDARRSEAARSGRLIFSGTHFPARHPIDVAEMELAAASPEIGDIHVRKIICRLALKWVLPHFV